MSDSDDDGTTVCAHSGATEPAGLTDFHAGVPPASRPHPPGARLRLRGKGHRGCLFMSSSFVNHAYSEKAADVVYGLVHCL